MTPFECQRCGACCRWPGYLYLTEGDVAKIARFLSLSEYEFVNRYADIERPPRLNLKTGENGSCVFLQKDDCAIHPVKPAQCAGFPTVWKIKGLEDFCVGQKRLSEKDAGRA